MSLTKEDIADIKKTWEIPKKSPKEIGVKILVRYFEVFPDHINKFDKFRNTPLQELKETEKFKNHAAQIMEVFSKTIDALDGANSEKNVQEVWQDVAKLHFRKKIPKQYFNDLKGVILEVLGPICQLPSNVEPWNKLFDLVYEVVFKTMDNLSE